MSHIWESQPERLAACCHLGSVVLVAVVKDPEKSNFKWTSINFDCTSLFHLALSVNLAASCCFRLCYWASLFTRLSKSLRLISKHLDEQATRSLLLVRTASLQSHSSAPASWKWTTRRIQDSPSHIIITYCTVRLGSDTSRPHTSFSYLPLFVIYKTSDSVGLLIKCLQYL